MGHAWKDVEGLEDLPRNKRMCVHACPWGVRPRWLDDDDQ